ncbi:MAG: DUF6084 family protein [Gemmatimonadaceae bacterium]
MSGPASSISPNEASGSAPALAPAAAPALTREVIPSLSFAIDDAGVVQFAAVPTLRFGIRIGTEHGEAIRSVMLCVQVRIAPGQRGYDDATRARLVEVFGQREQWATTMRTLLWTQTTLTVPAFTGSTTVDLLLPCTYDFDVVATKLLHGIKDGEIPLEFLFSGTVFYSGEQGQLRTARISWERDASYRLPATVWQSMMAHYFPNSAWLRLSQDVFDRLYAYKTQHTLSSWDAAVSALLDAAGDLRSPAAEY